MADVDDPTPSTFAPAPIRWRAERTAKLVMILGIVGASYGVLLGWLFPLPALVLGIIGLAKYPGAARNAQGTTGLVLGIVNTSIAGLYGLFWLLGLGLGLAGGVAEHPDDIAIDGEAGEWVEGVEYDVYVHGVECGLESHSVGLLGGRDPTGEFCVLEFELENAVDRQERVRIDVELIDAEGRRHSKDKVSPGWSEELNPGQRIQAEAAFDVAVGLDVALAEIEGVVISVDAGERL